MGSFTKQCISSIMAERIIEILEVVEIGDQNAHRCIFPHGSTDLTFQRSLHVAAVEETGKSVANGLCAKRFAQLEVRERHGEVVHHTGQEGTPRRSKILFN